VREPGEFEKYYQALGRVKQDKKETNEGRKGVEIAAKAIIAVKIHHIER